MRKDLYFIPLIADALRGAGSEAAMAAALERIVHLGQDGRHRQGYQQFLRFMASLLGPASCPAEAARAGLDRPTSVEVLVWRDDHPIPGVRHDGAGTVWTFPRCGPGEYRIAFDTGRLLWRGELDERDLIWSRAFPGEDLRMAADSEEVVVEPSSTSEILQGECSICCYPGLYCGTLVVRFHAGREGS